MPRTPNAQRQPHTAMTQASSGAAKTGPSVEPAAIRFDGSARRVGENQVCAEVSDMAVAGPSAPPRMIRVTSRMAAPPPSSIGNCSTAQVTPIANRIHFTEIFDARNPVTTETIAYRKKKALPMNPNSVAVKPSSGIASAETRPSTALSAKAMIWNNTSMPVTIQARLDMRPKSIRRSGAVGDDGVVTAGSLRLIGFPWTGGCEDAGLSGAGNDVMATRPYGDTREIFTVAAMRERADWSQHMKEER